MVAATPATRFLIVPMLANGVEVLVVHDAAAISVRCVVTTAPDVDDATAMLATRLRVVVD